MNIGLYAAATGIEAQNVALATISNNLANISTTAFKKSTVEFQDLLYQNLKPQGGDSGGGGVVPVGIDIGNGSQVASTTKVFTKGDFKQTGNQLDLAIDGDGFLEVKMPDGTSAYTRDGALKIGPTGEVTTIDGYPILSGFQPLNTGSSLYISQNGEVSAVSDAGKKSFQIQLARFANPGGLQSIGNNLYLDTAASGTPQLANAGATGLGFIRQGFLEMSNVNVTEEMVNLIMAQRSHEASVRAIQSGDEMLSRVNQIRRG